MSIDEAVEGVFGEYLKKKIFYCQPRTFWLTKLEFGAVNKPSGISSAQVLRDLQKYFNPSKLFAPWLEAERKNRARESHNQRFRRRKRDIQVKIGHGGTLDPLATGVLITGIGRGTKSLQDFLMCTKEYEAIVLFGTETDTYDRVGKVLKRTPYEHITQEMVEKALENFRGKFMQLPPLFSALKMNGKPLYEYAREGREIPREIEKRPVEVLELELLEWMEGGSHSHVAPTDEAGYLEVNLANQLWTMASMISKKKEDHNSNNSNMLPDSIDNGDGKNEKKDLLLSNSDIPHSDDINDVRNEVKIDNLKSISINLDSEALFEKVNDPKSIIKENLELESLSSSPSRKRKASIDLYTCCRLGNQENKIRKGDISLNSCSKTPENEDSETSKFDNTTPPNRVEKSPPAARLRMTVTSGFYVRSLCHDLGLAVKSTALMAELKRTRQGEFTVGENVLEYKDLEGGEEVWGPKVSRWLAEWMEKHS